MNKSLLLAMALLGSIAACNQGNSDRSNSSNSTLSFADIDPGTLVSRGDSISLRLEIPEGTAYDSIVYQLNEHPYKTVTDTTVLWLNTGNQSMGSKLITAQVYRGGTAERASTNIVVVGSKSPDQFGFSVVNTYPHDAHAYTQGLEYQNGYLYESTGLRGESTLRKVDLSSGKVLQKIDLPSKYFGEGMTFVGNQIVQLTWEEGVGFVYDKNTLEKKGEFPYQASKEGWGLCFDGKQLIKSDGSNRLYFLNKDTFREEGYIEVYNDKGPVDKLNELEFIDGKIYANVYYSDVIVVIDPQSGEVESEINLIGLLPQKDVTEDTNVLNGIAYDHQGKHLYVTGKNWDKLFEIKLLKD